MDVEKREINWLPCSVKFPTMIMWGGLVAGVIYVIVGLLSLLAFRMSSGLNIITEVFFVLNCASWITIAYLFAKGLDRLGAEYKTKGFIIVGLMVTLVLLSIVSTFVSSFIIGAIELIVFWKLLSFTTKLGKSLTKNFKGKIKGVGRCLRLVSDLGLLIALLLLIGLIILLISVGNMDNSAASGFKALGGFYFLILMIPVSYFGYIYFMFYKIARILGAGYNKKEETI